MHNVNHQRDMSGLWIHEDTHRKRGFECLMKMHTESRDLNNPKEWHLIYI